MLYIIAILNEILYNTFPINGYDVDLFSRISWNFI